MAQLRISESLAKLQRSGRIIKYRADHGFGFRKGRARGGARRGGGGMHENKLCNRKSDAIATAIAFLKKSH